MFSSDGSSFMEKVWIDRWNQKVDSAFSGLAHLQAKYGWEDLSFNKKMMDADNLIWKECLLLKSSLLRAKGEAKASSQLIAKIWKYEEVNHRTMNFKMQFELGLDHWSNEDFGSALDCFLLAEKLAKKNYEKVFALSNMLFALEAYDLERSRIEEKLEKYLGDTNNAYGQNVLHQYKAYKLRKQFYTKGEIKSFKVNVDRGQCEFFLNWLALLPYMKGRIDKSYDSLLDSKKYLWQGSYRVRTLQGYFVPNDVYCLRAGDAIDRLYLWTWLILTNNTEMNIKKISKIFQSILNNMDVKKLSIENRLLFRNATAWLELLSPAVIEGIGKNKKLLYSTKSINYPILENEFLLTHNINLLTNSSSKNTEGLYPPFEKYYFDVFDNRFLLLPRLKQIFRPLIQKKNMTCDHIVVDMRMKTVRNTRAGIIVKSPLLSKLFFLIANNKEFKIESINKKYSVNKRSIYNLLSRAKKINSDMRVSIRGDSILCHENKDRYRVIGDLDLTHMTSNDMETPSGQFLLDDWVSHSAVRLVFPDSM